MVNVKRMFLNCSINLFQTDRKDCVTTRDQDNNETSGNVGNHRKQGKEWQQTKLNGQCCSSFDSHTCYASILDSRWRRFISGTKPCSVNIPLTVPF